MIIGMKAIVDPEVCVGCGLCAEICPEVFQMAGDLAEVKVEAVPKEAEAACRHAMNDCPVSAISVVE
jgi:ferredoxin